MVNSILIGKKIFSILSKDLELKEAVKGQIYPLLANKSTQYPFIVYSRDSITPSYCKDLYGGGQNYQDDVGVTVIVVSDDYEQSVEISNKVRESLELLVYEDDDIYIADTVLTGVSESTSDDAYVQRMNFNLIIQ